MRCCPALLTYHRCAGVHADLSKNRLQAIPAGFESLENLKHLNLANNRVAYLSPLLGQLRLLHTLNLDNNNITDVPASFSALTALRTLHLCRNRLVQLPASLSSLGLTHLRLDHNELETLDEDLFAGPLGASLKYLSMHDNNLLQLPRSLVGLAQDTYFSADSNPLISPPPALLAHGKRYNVMHRRGGHFTK